MASELSQDHPASIFHGFVEGAILAIVLPVFQTVLFETQNAINSVSSAGTDPAGMIAAIQLMGTMPLLMTLAGFGWATARGKIFGFVGFLLGTIGGNVLFSNPRGGIILMMIGAVFVSIGIGLNG